MADGGRSGEAEQGVVWGEALALDLVTGPDPEDSLAISDEAFKAVEASGLGAGSSNTNL